MPITLAAFDPSRDFVAKCNFRAGGSIWLRKQPFDKTAVNDRVLRQLYEGRKIGYPDATDAGPAPLPTPLVDDTPAQQHETVVEQQNTDGASGAPDSTAPDAPTETATGEAEENNAPTVDEKAAVAPDGETATAAAASPEDREAVIKRLVNRHTHDQLFDKASGLKGVTKDQTKAEIAGALVDAGRVGDGPA